MLVITNDVVAQVLTIGDTMDVLESVMREEALGTAGNRRGQAIHVPTEDRDEVYRFESMTGGSRGLQAMAIRVKSDILFAHESNGKWREGKYAVRPGLFCGLIHLFSTSDAAPLAILPDGVIQHMRVGATLGVGAKFMARPDARVLGMLGSGGMARTYAQAAALARPIERIQVYSPTREHRLEYAEEMAEKLGVEVVALDSPEQAAEGADLLAAMTDSLDPVIFPAMLRPGMHVCGVHGGVSPEALELVNWSTEYVSGNALDQLVEGPHWEPKWRGGGPERPQRASEKNKLTDVIVGRLPGRHDAQEITHFHTVGTGTQFAAVAKLVYDRAREAGLGHQLPDEWFVQDVRD